MVALSHRKVIERLSQKTEMLMSNINFDENLICHLINENKIASK